MWVHVHIVFRPNETVQALANQIKGGSASRVIGRESYSPATQAVSFFVYIEVYIHRCIHGTPREQGYTSGTSRFICGDILSYSYFILLCTVGIVGIRLDSETSYFVDS